MSEYSWTGPEMNLRASSVVTSQTELLSDTALIELLRNAMRESAELLDRLDSVASGRAALHLAVMHEPFLKYILDGSKTIESRFSVNRVAPYDHVEPGDIVLLKRLGHDIAAAAVIDGVIQFRLNELAWATIYEEYGEEMRAPEEFFIDRAAASYATLMKLTFVVATIPIHIPKHDRRGWAVLIGRHAQLSLL